MIGLDTNVVVRYLAQDDPIQSRQATQLIERTLTEENPGFVSLVAMAETVWVLERAYGLSDRAIAAAIEAMLATDVLEIESEQEVYTAMIALKDGSGSFADALIGALGTKAGCTHTFTFDRHAARLAGFTLLASGA
jgi:predicted nucleic-acid-binding protein